MWRQNLNTIVSRTHKTTTDFGPSFLTSAQTLQSLGGILGQKRFKRDDQANVLTMRTTCAANTKIKCSVNSQEYFWKWRSCSLTTNCWQQQLDLKKQLPVTAQRHVLSWIEGQEAPPLTVWAKQIMDKTHHGQSLRAHTMEIYCVQEGAERFEEEHHHHKIEESSSLEKAYFILKRSSWAFYCKLISHFVKSSIWGNIQYGCARTASRSVCMPYER